MVDEPDSNIKNATNALWNEVKTAVDNVFGRDLTAQEFYYLLSLYPYLEICDADYPYLDDDVKPIITSTKNGWKIFDFGSVLISGSYELFTRSAMRHKMKLDENEDDEGGKGTIVRQYSDVAFELIQLAIDKGWTGAEIISGFYPMQRIAWIAAAEKGFQLKGFDPTPEDYVVQSWVNRLRDKTLYPPPKPFMKASDKVPKRS